MLGSSQHVHIAEIFGHFDVFPQVVRHIILSLYRVSEFHKSLVGFLTWPTTCKDFNIETYIHVHVTEICAVIFRYNLRY
jgi:hypothetical protein